MDALEAIVDRLLPADEDAPGALELGLADAVRARSPLPAGWLERQADFPSLEPAARDARLSELDAAGDAGFVALVELVHGLYYADPRSWPGLGWTSGVPGRT